MNGPTRNKCIAPVAEFARTNDIRRVITRTLNQGL